MQVSQPREEGGLRGAGPLELCGKLCGGGVGISLVRRAKGRGAHGQRRVAQEQKAKVMHCTAEGQGARGHRAEVTAN